MGLGLGLAIGSFALDAYGSYRQNEAAKKAKNKRASYFDDEIAPTLQDSITDPDIDFGAIEDVEMGSVISGFQNQLKSINQNDSTMKSRGNFASNSFVNKETSFNNDLAIDSFDKNRFDVDRTIMSLQQQMEDTLADNKLRAKELEYNYKYG